MASFSRAQTGWLVASTVALAASLTAMFVVSGFQPVWFWTTLAGYALAVILVFVVGGPSAFASGQSGTTGEAPWVRRDKSKPYAREDFKLPERPTARALAEQWTREAQELERPRTTVAVERPFSRPDAATEIPSATTADVEAAEDEEPTDEFGPEGLTTEAEEEEIASEPEPAPAGFQHEGFTLYERTIKGRTSRFFGKGPSPGAVPIDLPAGFETVWDKKLKKPVLQEIAPPPAPVVAAAARPEIPTALRKCSAMTDLGEFCNHAARPESPYCSTHKNFKPGQGQGDFEVVLAKPGTAKPVKLGLGSFEVQVARPTGKAAKPIKGRPVQFEVETARPEATAKPLKTKESKVDVQISKPNGAKPLRVGDAKLEARMDKPTAPPPLEVEEEEAVAYLDVGQGSRDPIVRTVAEIRPAQIGRGPRPLDVDTEVSFETQKPKAPPKPLRVREPVLDVRTAKPKAVGKALRPATLELQVRTAKPKPIGKALRVGAVTPVVKTAKPSAARPLRPAVVEPTVRPTKTGRPAKPLRPGLGEVEVRTAKPKGLDGKSFAALFSVSDKIQVVSGRGVQVPWQESDRKVVDVEGIGAAYTAKLRKIGVETIHQLHAADSTAVVMACGVHPTVVSQWKSMIELTDVRGVGPQYSELLVRSGVRTIRDLAAAEPKRLQASIERTAEERGQRIQRGPQGLKSVTKWIEAAKGHPLAKLPALRTDGTSTKGRKK